MSLRVEMCFCMLKDEGDVLTKFTQVICDLGWCASKSIDINLPYGPVYSTEFYKDINSENKKELLVEFYNYPQKYDEYLLIFRPSKIEITNHGIDYCISEEYYNLIRAELENIDFYCGNMGLESHGFEKCIQDDRYDVNTSEVKYITDNLLDLAYISYACKKNSYDISPIVLDKYEQFDLINGRLYLRHNLLLNHK